MPSLQDKRAQTSRSRGNYLEWQTVLINIGRIMHLWHTLRSVEHQRTAQHSKRMGDSGSGFQEHPNNAVRRVSFKTPVCTARKTE
jgi:hypothetical protein